MPALKACMFLFAGTKVFSGFYNIFLSLSRQFCAKSWTQNGFKMCPIAVASAKLTALINILKFSSYTGAHWWMIWRKSKTGLAYNVVIWWFFRYNEIDEIKKFTRLWRPICLFYRGEYFNIILLDAFLSFCCCMSRSP